MIGKWTCAVVCLFACTEVLADAALPTEHLVPGGVAIVPLGQHREQPQVYFLEKKAAVVPVGKEQWTAVIGLPLSLPPGQARAVVQKPDGASRTVFFTVQEKMYPKQSIRITNPRQVKPRPEDVVRIKKESKKFESILSQWQPQAIQDWELLYPVKAAPISGVFGAQRIINGDPKSPHKGIDLAATTGTPIMAASTGKVVELADYFYTGKTLVLDHGQGFKTLYCHLNTTQVKLNQNVQKGEVIGTVGSTGRATGPHLHFGVSLNNVRVDPMIFLAPS